MARRQGGTLGTFTPLSTPNAPTGLSVSTSIGSASVSFTAPTDTGDGAITSYIVTAIDESTGVSTGATGSASPIEISGIGGQTVKIRAQAVNNFGPGRLTEFDTGNVIYSGASLWGWGDGGDGVVGDNTAVNRSSPVQVGSLTTWSSITVGSRFALAVKTDGTLWSWGGNTQGQLGVGDTITKSSPVQIGALTTWYQVAAGTQHAAALRTDGTLWTWGDGGDGRLGDGTVVPKSSPVQVGVLTNWAQVSAGTGSTASIKTDGTLWSWGSNTQGQLGQNNTIDRSSPVQIGALTNWSKVSTGENANHWIAIKTDGTLWACGQGSSGRLGDGTTVNKSSPVQVGALTNWSQVSAALSTSFAVTNGGTLFGWGDNSPNGQLGDGTVLDRSSPVQIGSLTNWFQVSTGSNHTAAVKTDGTMWTWGSGLQGKLGHNNIISRSSPVQVGALTDWTQVAAGEFNTLALYGVV